MYLFYFDTFYWYYLDEFIKTTTFYVLTGYFALSVIRFKITPLYITRKYPLHFFFSFSFRLREILLICKACDYRDGGPLFTYAGQLHCHDDSL